MLDFSYDDFVELYQLREKLSGPKSPRYSIVSMSIDVAAKDDRAALAVKLRIDVPESDWTKIPLSFTEAYATESPQHRGEGDFLFSRDEKGDGYCCWIRTGGKKGIHEITIPFDVPLTALGVEKRLHLQLPRAAVSELRLTVPEPSVLVRVSEGAIASPSEPAEKERTTFAFSRIGGDFEAAWQAASRAASPQPQTVEAKGRLLARFSDRELETEAILTVKCVGDPINRFRVRLPKGMTCDASAATDYAVSPVAEKDDNKDATASAEVKLTRKTAGPFEVRLTARRPLPSDPAETMELSGFHIVEATRETGTIALSAPSDRQIVWIAMQGLTPSDVPSESTSVENAVGLFDYAAMPFSLSVRLTPRRTRILLEPDYAVRIHRDRAELDARWSFSVQGSRLFAVQMQLGSWEIDEIGPENVVVAEAITNDGKGNYTIPLQEPTRGSVSLRLRAHQALPPGESVFSLSLPQPLDAAATPASLTVAAAENVELFPQTDAMQGLVRQSSGDAYSGTERRQEALRYRSDSRRATFVAQKRYHARQVATTMVGTVNLQEEAIRVKQEVRYSVSYEPIDRLTFTASKALATDIVFYLDGKPLTAKMVTEPFDPLSKDDPFAKNEDALREIAVLKKTEAIKTPVDGMKDTIRIVVALPQPLLGNPSITAEYSIPYLEPLDAEAENADVPILVPEDGAFAGNSITVVAPAGWKTSVKDSRWRPLPTSLAVRTPSLGYSVRATEPFALLPLNISRENAEQAGTFVVERGLVQTWFIEGGRQDRAACRFAASKKDLTVQLPAGAVASQALIVLDGRRVTPQYLGENRLRIAVQSENDLRRHILELRYHFENVAPPTGRVSVAFPQFEDEAWMRRCYWQLILPADEHVVTDPDGFNAEFCWRFLDYYWGRRPLMDLTQLENWIGIPNRASTPPLVNIYLYSAIGRIESAEFRAARRSTIVLFASGGDLGSRLDRSLRACIAASPDRLYRMRRFDRSRRIVSRKNHPHRSIGGVGRRTRPVCGGVEICDIAARLVDAASIRSADRLGVAAVRHSRVSSRCRCSSIR